MARYQRPVLNFNASDVWAAACAAQRINGNYVKAVSEVAEGQNVKTNRQIVEMFLGQTDLIQQADRDLAEKVRTYYKGFTFRILKGIKLNEFDSTAMTIANRDTIESTYDLAVICSLPSCYERAVKRDSVNQRVEFASGGFISSPGSKVRLNNIEVLKSNYSQQYGVYFVTCLTAEDQVLFFSYKNGLEVGKFVSIEATVKAHRDNSTQLNRAKVV